MYENGAFVSIKLPPIVVYTGYTKKKA